MKHRWDEADVWSPGRKVFWWNAVLLNIWLIGALKKRGRQVIHPHWIKRETVIKFQLWAPSHSTLPPNKSFLTLLQTRLSAINTKIGNLLLSYWIQKDRRIELNRVGRFLRHEVSKFHVFKFITEKNAENFYIFLQEILNDYYSTMYHDLFGRKKVPFSFFWAAWFLAQAEFCGVFLWRPY